MAVRYEWQETRGRRRFVRIQDDTPDAPKLPSKRTRPVTVAEASVPKRRGRPPKVKPPEDFGSQVAMHGGLPKDVDAKVHAIQGDSHE